MIFKRQIEKILCKILKNESKNEIPNYSSDEDALILILKILIQNSLDPEQIIIWKCFIVSEIDRFSKINTGTLAVGIVLIILASFILFISLRFRQKHSVTVLEDSTDQSLIVL